MFAANTFLTILRRQNPSSLQRLDSISIQKPFSTIPQPKSSPNSVNSVNSNPIMNQNPLDIAFHKAIQNFRQLLSMAPDLRLSLLVSYHRNEFGKIYRLH